MENLQTCLTETNILLLFILGRMAEWSNAAVLKTAEPETVPGVRIPLLPPYYSLETIQVLPRVLPDPGYLLHHLQVGIRGFQKFLPEKW